MSGAEPSWGSEKEKVTESAFSLLQSSGAVMHNQFSPDADLEPRKGRPSPRLASAELAKITAAAWDAYENSRKSPKTRIAGPEFKDPDYNLSVDWLAACGAIQAAQRRHDDPNGPIRFLLINGLSRANTPALARSPKSIALGGHPPYSDAQRAD